MIQDWSGFVDDCNPSINLCYGHNIQNKSPIEVLHNEKEREEWCVENGFEYVFDEDRKPSTQFNDDEGKLLIQLGESYQIIKNLILVNC